jgi:hypothetical protein
VALITPDLWSCIIAYYYSSWTFQVFPFVLVMTGCDFRQLFARQMAQLLLNPAVLPNATILPIDISTVAQKRTFLNVATMV